MTGPKVFGQDVQVRGFLEVDTFTVNTSLSLPANQITRVSLVNGAACSIVGRSANSIGAEADIAASTNDTVFMRKANALVFDKIPVTAFDVTGTLDDTRFLNGAGVFTNSLNNTLYVNGLSTAGNVGCNTVYATNLDVSVSVQLPVDSIVRAALVNGSACSIIGRSANSSGAVADIPMGTNDRLLGRVSNVVQSTQLTAGMFPNNIVTNAILRDSPSLSLMGNGSSSPGDPSDISAIGSGDVLFIENSSIIFDNWIRQRRNIMRGFWEFEQGNGHKDGTALADAVNIVGTPFWSHKVGTGLISQAARGGTYSRNCLTLGIYSVGDQAGFYMNDVISSANGIPTNAGPLIFEAGVQCNTISAASNDYTINVGFLCDKQIADRGVFFQYERATSGNVWRLIARAFGTTTTVSAATVAVATEYRLRIEITSASNANFYVNGAYVGNVTSNIPTLVGMGATMYRTSSSAGAVAYWDVDYVAYQLALSTPRSATQR